MFSVWRFFAAFYIIFIDSMIESLLCYSRCDTWLPKPTSPFMLCDGIFLTDPYPKFINETYPTLPARIPYDDYLITLLHLLLARLVFWSITIASNFEFFEAAYFEIFIFLFELVWFWFSLVNCREAVLYSLRNLISLIILISFVALAPIFEALEALATLATLAVVWMAPLPPEMSWSIHTRSKNMVRVEMISSQK